MFWDILRKDLKRKKTINIVILLFIILAAMFVASGLNNVLTVVNGTDYYLNQADIGDYVVLTQQGDGGVPELLDTCQYVKDYRITQDMARKLCKLHHTAVSAAYRPQPFDWDALLGLLHKKPPRRSSYEAQLSDSDSLVTTTQIAKEYGCGAKVFNRLLHLHGIQYRVNGQWVLYSEHHGKGYTSSLTFRLQRSDGSEVEKLHTAWTQKGRKFLYHTLKRRGVLPLAEQGG